MKNRIEDLQNLGIDRFFAAYNIEDGILYMRSYLGFISMIGGLKAIKEMFDSFKKVFPNLEEDRFYFYPQERGLLIEFYTEIKDFDLKFDDEVFDKPYRVLKELNINPRSFYVDIPSERLMFKSNSLKDFKSLLLKLEGLEGVDEDFTLSVSAVIDKLFFGDAALLDLHYEATPVIEIIRLG